jgi:maltooligosyltrehalose trehalohydrolase
MKKFIVCLQNHDQVGNRALGDRLHHNVDAAIWRAASTVLLTSPMTPLLFMGQEWAASSPFQYFTDLEPELGRDVTEGRRREFKDFPGFVENAGPEQIPDPQDRSTFLASKLTWEERDQPEHAATLALYKALLHLRQSHASLGASDELAAQAWAADDGSLVMRRTKDAETHIVVARLCGSGNVCFGQATGGASNFSVVLSTEDARYATGPQPPDVSPGGAAHVVFRRPGAVILKQR